MKRGAVLVLLVGLFLCAPAEAVQIVGPHGKVARRYQRWANHAKVPTVQRTIVLTFDRTIGATGGNMICGGYVACSDLGRIYTSERDRWVTLHELGHQFDFFVLTPADRARFTRIGGMGPGDWWEPRDGVWWSPGEEFAQTYAECAYERPVESTEIAAWRVRRGCKLIRASYRRSEPHMRNRYVAT